MALIQGKLIFFLRKKGHGIYKDFGIEITGSNRLELKRSVDLQCAF